MSQQSPEKSWTLPKSYDLGVPYYFHNLLKDSPYVDAFMREFIAQQDTRVVKFFDYESGEYHTEVEDTGGRDPLEISVSAVRDALRCSGVPDHLVSQMGQYLHHMQSSDEGIDLLKLKEFLAFTGVSGVYDLEQGTHFQVVQKVKELPMFINPKHWVGFKHEEKTRDLIGQLMAQPEDIPAHQEQIAKLVAERQAKTVEVLDAFDAQGKDRNDVTQADVEAHFPEFQANKAEETRLRDELKAAYAAAAEKYAPKDPAAYPVLNPKFDMKWDESFMDLLGNRVMFEEKYDKALADQGRPKGSDQYVPYNHTTMRNRAYFISDWIMRDYTLSQQNRGEMAKFSREDIPARFVLAVKAELDDGLLQLLDAPHRIQPSSTAQGKYDLVLNGYVVEQFDLKDLDAIQALADKNGKFNRDMEERAKRRRERNQRGNKPATAPEQPPQTAQEAPSSVDSPEMGPQGEAVDNIASGAPEGALPPMDEIPLDAYEDYGYPPDVASAIDDGYSAPHDNRSPGSGAQGSPDDTPPPHIEGDPQDYSSYESAELSNEPPQRKRWREDMSQSEKEAEDQEQKHQRDDRRPKHNGSAGKHSSYKNRPGAKSHGKSPGASHKFAPGQGASASAKGDEPGINFGQPNKPRGPSQPKEAKHDTDSPLNDRAKKAMNDLREHERGGYRHSRHHGSPGGGGGGGMAIDLGFGAIVGAVASIAGSALGSLSTKRVKPGDFTAGIEAATDNLATCRSFLGAPARPGHVVTDDMEKERWETFGNALKSLNASIKGVSKFSATKYPRELGDALQRARAEILQSKGVIDSAAAHENDIGEMARDLKETAQELAEMVAKIVKTILQLLGLERDAAPRP